MLALDEPFGRLGKEIKRDVHHKDMDAKIILTSHNSRPGLGKTTLAIKMARDFDRHGWVAHEKAFMDANEYHGAYEDLPSGSVLLFDEIEGEADKRRSMSNKNVELSQAYAQNRYRNMITICTLPSVSMLDKRLLEMSDYWINVMDRGVAHPYRILVNDFTGKVIRTRIDDDAVITYTDLPDGDPDYERLKEEKHFRRTSISQDYIKESEHLKEVEKAKKAARRELRNEAIRELYGKTQFSSRDLSEFDWCNLETTSVSGITSGVEKKCELNKEYRDILIRELWEQTDMSQTDIASQEWCDLSQPRVNQIISGW